MKTNNDRERRYRPSAEFRVEPDSNEKPRMITGTAVVYDSASEDLGGFIEIIKPGTFTASLKTADVRALINHDLSYPLGRTKYGTLRLLDDDKALRVEIDPPSTTYVADLIENIRAKNLAGMSFGFMATEQEWGRTADGTTLRTITKAEIFDVSVVSDPAYPETSVALRSLQAWQGQSPNEVQLLKVQLREKYFRPQS